MATPTDARWEVGAAANFSAGVREESGADGRDGLLFHRHFFARWKRGGRPRPRIWSWSARNFRRAAAAAADASFFADDSELCHFSLSHSLYFHIHQHPSTTHSLESQCTTEGSFPPPIQIPKTCQTRVPIQKKCDKLLMPKY